MRAGANAMSATNKCNIFVSYARKDDEHDGQLIQHAITQLKSSIGVKSRVPFDIFIDKSSLEWGDIWDKVIQRRVSDSVFMIAFMSPSYFSSGSCQNEWGAFRQLEKSASTNNLILPIYYRPDREFEAATRDASTASPFVADLAQRNYIDWRDIVNQKDPKKHITSAIGKLSDAIEIRMHTLSELFLSAARAEPDTTLRARFSSVGAVESVDPAFEASIGHIILA
jgi:TIR domain